MGEFDGTMEERGLNFFEQLSAEPENGGLNFFEQLSASAELLVDGECPALHDNAQLTCSIDASGQVRPGSSQYMLDKAMSDMANARAAGQSFMHYYHVCLFISLCLFARSCSVDRLACHHAFACLTSAFGRETGDDHLAQSLL